MPANGKYNLIFEQTSVVPYDQIKIIEETTVGGKPKLAFSALLQEQDVLNANKRRYSQAICESIVNRLAPRVNNRSCLLEIDHPMFVSSDPDTLKKRAAIVELNNCAAVLRKLELKNGQIIGEIETLSGFKGPDLANLITKDKINIGFSLRALGGVEPLQDGTLVVTEPIMPITYDIVTNPSHQNARVVTFLPESAGDFIPENPKTLICENADVMSIIENDHLRICDGDSCVVKFIDDIINEQFLEVIGRRLVFKF
jgi:hypothetical protein